ncbi:MAG: CTP synthase [Candidatus Tyloplasma litorale]|nr:MAG: CTP synthase [Mycoplasmatales bacterium]
MKKIAFVTGGVVSSLGKGIIASSLGRLLIDNNINVGMMKCDPYLNIDPGTMSPIEHGEVFVTVDGGETDLDIGHYERFLGKNLTKESSLTSGKIYQEVLDKERRGEYNGKTVQIVPHITNHIKEKIYKLAENYDLLIVEVGGSIGDIESLAYIETIRQIKYELSDDAIVIHAGFVPLIKVSNELKTKPMQRSVNLLRSLGVSPEILITRSEVELSEREVEKIGMFATVKKEYIFQCVDEKSIYKIPISLMKQNFPRKIAALLNLNISSRDIKEKHYELINFNEKLNNLESEVKIAIVGKYVSNADSYISIVESLKHAGINNKIKIKYDLINSRNYLVNSLKNYDGILVPGGFGNDGTIGKMEAIKFARENNIPFLGICFGMQLAILEFAKNVCNLNVEHGELQIDAEYKIIDIMEDMKDKIIGGTMRLGNYQCSIKNHTLAREIYGNKLINERHRHRYEFNNKFTNDLKKEGMIISGIHPKTNLAEIIELPKNDFFIGVQFHPELSSKLTKPNKLIEAFIKAALKNKK